MTTQERPRWTHVERPATAEVDSLCATLPRNLVHHALDADEVARIDREGDVTLVILRVPQLVHERRGPRGTVALGVLLDHERTVSITRGHTDVVARARQALGPEASPREVLLRQVMATAESFIELVRRTDAEVTAIEARLSSSLANREVLQLLQHQQRLVHFMTALGSNEIMLERLARDSHLELTAAEQELLDDARVELRQALQMVRVSTDLLSQMMDAFASIISNNLNVVMKVLTSLTMVLTVPVLIASLYGMNVPLPGQSHPHAFWLVLGVSLFLAISVVVLFWKRRWL